MSNSEEQYIWTQIDLRLIFNPDISVDSFPGIREPDPSRTYDISQVYNSGEEHFIHCENDLNLKILKALRECLSEMEPVYALDWQHACYWFFPHVEFEANNPDAWSVPVIPNGDYYIFVTADLRLGIFGHPWAKTISVWGQKFLNVLQKDTPILFQHIIRKNGLAV